MVVTNLEGLEEEDNREEEVEDAAAFVGPAVDESTRITSWMDT